MNSSDKWSFIRALLSPEDGAILIGASAGGLLSLLFLGEKVTWKIALATMLSALATSYYGVRYVSTLLHLEAGFYGLIGLVFGLAAFSVMSGVFKLLRMWRESPGDVLTKIAQYIPFLKGNTPS